jgi:hypothetical protein
MQTLKFTNHLQVWQSLNYQIGSMGHTMNLNIRNLPSDTSPNPLKNKKPH